MPGSGEAAGDGAPILLVPYMWIGDFVRCHSIVRLLKLRNPDAPVDVLSENPRVQRTVLTAADGTYAAPDIPVGNFRARASDFTSRRAGWTTTLIDAFGDMRAAVQVRRSVWATPAWAGVPAAAGSARGRGALPRRAARSGRTAGGIRTRMLVTVRLFARLREIANPGFTRTRLAGLEDGPSTTVWYDVVEEHG